MSINNSILSINNINTTSTTIFNNLNSLSTNSTLSINNINTTSTSLLNMINSLTGSSTITNLNNLSTYSALNISNLQATSTTIFNKTNFSNLVVSNASTLLSSLNITGNIIGSGTALTNLNYNAILNPPSIVSFNNPATFISTLNVSGRTTLNNAATLISSLNVSGTTTLQGNLDCGGGIAINGSNAFFNPFGTIDSGNLTNTYINFKQAGSTDDWCYLRQIGPSNSYKLALDFHDDDADARFCIRKIQSTTNPDTIAEVFTVDNGNVSCTGNVSATTASIGGDTNIGGSVRCSGVLQTGNQLAIRGSAEWDTATLFLATPHNSSSAYKCALIAQGMNTWGRSKLHFCLNNVESNTFPTQKANLSNSRMVIDYNGRIGISNSDPLSM